MKLIPLCLFFCFSTSSPAESESKNLGNILLLGDSITRGQNPEGTQGGYRLYLGEKLQGSGYDFTFVGSCSDNSRNMPVKMNSHEGHGGWQIEAKTPDNEGIYHDMAHNIEKWIKAAQPQYILLHIGTNDLGWIGDSVEQASQELERLLKAITECAPEAHLIVAQITPLRTPEKGPINVQKTIPYNASVVKFVKELSSQGKKISCVDMYTSLDSDKDIGGMDLWTKKWDETHPNTSGYQKIADVWFRGIVSIAESRSDESK